MQEQSGSGERTARKRLKNKADVGGAKREHGMYEDVTTTAWKVDLRSAQGWYNEHSTQGTQERYEYSTARAVR